METTIAKKNGKTAPADEPSNRAAVWAAGKHVLVTGASSGIGREMCMQLAGVAARLTLVSRNTGGKLEALVEDLREAGERRSEGTTTTQFVPVSLDVRDKDAMAELVRNVYEVENGQIDAFINCAGGSHFFGPLETMSHEDIEQIFDINAKAPIFWLRELLPRMKKNKLAAGDQKRAHVMMLSSRSGERALPKLSVYASSKGAIEKLVEAVRTEYASYRVAFTLVNPGSINTPFTDQWAEETRLAHNVESMSVEESIVPILTALNAQYSINKVSYQSIEQWTGEPGVMKADA